jgi:hypothetical protein
MIYDPFGHALLSVAAKALLPADLSGLAEAAEVELGLAGSAYTGADYDRAVLAVVYWINCHVATLDAGGVIASRSEKKLGESVSVTYATGTKGGTALDPCAKAYQLARSLLDAGGYQSLQTIR